jgi:hypothetical protein
MPISLEEVYISALKTQMKKWKQGVVEEKATPERVMSTIKTFLFNETLCKEITKAALLMCDSPERLESKIQELIAYIHTLITIDTDILKAWDTMKNQFRYDDEHNLVWMDLGTIPEVVARRGWDVIKEGVVHQSSHSRSQKAPTPNAVMAMPTEPKLRLKLYIVGGKFWDLPPITPRQRIGLVLSHVVPFSNWNGLHCSIDRGNDEGIWRDIYMDSRERYSGKTEPQIMKDVMEKLDTVQTEAFGTLRDDPTTILSLNLGVKGVFKMPKDIQPWTGVGSAIPDNVDSLLTSLKTYV